MRKPVLILALIAVATVARAGETEITGFVDAAYFYDSADKNGEFSLDQVEVDIIHQASEKAMLRADVEWVRDGEDMVAQVEQGFLKYSFAPAWAFKFGRFNAPIGFEALDPVDMYQYSHAMVFEYGIPTNLTGAALTWEFGSGFDIVGHMSNGWESNTKTGANTTFGGRFGYAQGGFDGGLSVIGGNEDDPDTGDPFSRAVADIDLGFETDIWLFGAELNSGKVTTTTAGVDTDQKWSAFLFMTHVRYASWTGLTLRYDNFDDKDGWTFDTVGGQGQNISSLTICPTFHIDENFAAALEYRYFKNDVDGFTDKDGVPTDGKSTIAFEMVARW